MEETLKGFHPFLLFILLGSVIPFTASFAISESPAPSRIWASAWADAPSGASGPASAEQTFREIVKPTVGSRGTVRLHFSNYFGSNPVTIGAAHIGIQSSGATIRKDVVAKFHGGGSVTIAPGGFAISDDVPLKFSYGDILAVTEYISGSWQNLTQHNQGGGSVTSYATVTGAGNKTADQSGDSFTEKTFKTYLLDRLDVYGDYKETIAAFGSSTTDGVHSGLDQHKTYPEQLAAALHAAGRDNIAVANVGISGNEVLRASPISGISRFRRDVISLPNVRAVIDYLGANDLRNSCVSADTFISGTRNLISQAHNAGLKFYLATTAPSTFCGAQTPHGFGTRFAQGSGQEAQRLLVNSWDLSTQPSIVNGKTEQPPDAEAVIDFSGALTDPANTSYMLPQYNSGDNIHPNASGYEAMVKAIPLSLF